MIERYASLDRTLWWLGAEALEEFPEDQLGVINPLPFRRSGLVAAGGAPPAILELDGFSARTLTLGDTETTPAPPRDGSRIANEGFAVEVASDGTLTVEDRRTGRRFEGLHPIEDELDMGDLYNFCPVAGDEVWRCRGATSRILSDGPICSELEVCYEGERPARLDSAERVGLSVKTIVRLVQGSHRIEFETTVNNAAEDHRLRVVFPVGQTTGPVRAEGQFAVIRRPLHPPQPRAQWCEPPDPTQHTVGAVALGSVALFTRGLPEYEARAGRDGAELCLTLLRCVGMISRPSGAISTRPLGAGPPTPTPEGQCLGRHRLEYALRFDADRLEDVALVRASQDYRCPFLVVPTGVHFEAPVTIEGDVVFSCLKGAEDGDGLALRVFNPGAKAAATRIGGPVAIERMRLDETGGTPVEDGLVDVAPGEIATLRLRVR
jgi:hypothetical protein